MLFFFVFVLLIYYYFYVDSILFVTCVSLPGREVRIYIVQAAHFFYLQDFISLVVQAVGGGMAATAPDLTAANLVNNHSISPLLLPT
jgi:hypothetical protein